MYILGVSAFYHDSSACLILNGKIIAAVQEERFTRKKHDASFPVNAIKYCLKAAKISAEKIEKVVFYEKPFLKFERLLETYLAFAPRGFKSFSMAMPSWIKDKLFQKTILKKSLEEMFGKKINWYDRLMFSEHHLSHAASAFYPSTFENAAILSLDGVGEWATTSIGIGHGREITIEKEIHFPHSLGLLYSAFTYYTGFKVNSGEYKVMGLAPYGEPIYYDVIKDNLINISQDGSFQLNMEYFDFATGLKMTNYKFHQLFKSSPRIPEDKLTQKEMDLAASIQKITEEVVVKIAQNIVKETSQKNICLAGGVALNCVANGILLRKNLFEKIWIQPASGDSGGSLGAALAVWHLHYRKERKISKSEDSMKGSYLGPYFKNDEVKTILNGLGAKYTKLNESNLIDKVSSLIADGKAVGWFQGKMEFGPRALGARSIIADPRSEKIQKQLNLKVKFRESFRPFAPSVLFEHLSDWFEINDASPYMLLVADVKKEKCREMTGSEKKLFGIKKLNVVRSSIPAVTHVDYSARIQTVHKKTNPRYHSLISSFYKKTKVPLLVNTSFNIRGEPIVCTPEDAYRCFMGTDLDVLVIENFLLIKSDQDKGKQQNYKAKYELD